MLNKLLLLGVLQLAACNAFAQLREASDSRILALPAVGETTVRVVSPTVIELTRISSSDGTTPGGRPGASTAVLDSPLAAASRMQVTAGGRNYPVASSGWKRRVVYAPLARRDLRIATSLYLRLAQPIAAQQGPVTVEVVDASGSFLRNPNRQTVEFDGRRYSPAIHTNQEGYVPDYPKRAMVGYYLGDLGELDVPENTEFSLVDAKTGNEVFQGKLTLRPDSGYPSASAPYQRVLEADFSAFKQPGEYQLRVAGLGASAPFLIDDGIAMGFLRTYMLGLYHQRCGVALGLPFTRFGHGLDHAAPAQIPSPQNDPQFAFTWTKIAEYTKQMEQGRTQKAPPISSEATQLYPFVRHGAIDVAGGHHDAGDYSKYTVNSAWLVHYLVFAVDSIAGVAALDNLGIAESGDGIPDVLQEAKWESDFLAKLQDTDGGFYFLVYPKGREYESNVLPDKGDAQVVWPKNTAVTAAAVAALAQAASSPAFRKHFPNDAARYLRQAQLGWQFLTNAIAKHGKDGAYQKITHYADHYTHDDELAWAACELYLATGDTQYRDKLTAWLPNPADPATFRWGWWRMSESWGNAIRSYAFAVRSGRQPASAIDARYLAICEGQVLAAGDDIVTWTSKNAYGTPFPTATKAVLGGGWYFSLDTASDAAIAYQIEPKPAYIDALVSAMNYEAGTNPVNKSFVTGLGLNRQREIVSQYAQNDRRALPPSGFPLGNIHVGLPRLPAYGAEMVELSYPRDDGPRGYAPYDRWTDVHNTSTEFITLNNARAVTSTAVLAANTGAAKKPWKPLPARIDATDANVQLNTPMTLRFDAGSQDLAGARIVWEGRDSEPAFGRTYTFTPKTKGPQWIEAEAAWPDGRRAFAVHEFVSSAPLTTWFDGALPSGASPGASGGDGWNWVTPNPAPPEGAGVRAHQSNLAPGLHEHWFTGAESTMGVSADDTLFAWVYLEPENMPSEIMIMWNDGGSWEHRAYWGANTITYGQNGSPGRRRIGNLPPGGQWVKLTVPAADVGLVGMSVSGMGFAAVGGRVSWGATGAESKK